MSESRCSIETGRIAGWSAVTLTNGLIDVTVLPDKGADVYQFIDVGSGIDVLGKTPWGLQPPGSPPRPGSAGAEFLHNYEGGWQELFPNTFGACSHDGVELPLHGEVATLPWTVDIESDDEDNAQIALTVSCRRSPFSLTRRMSVARDVPEVRIDETVRNTSSRPVPFVWGHHILLGAPFLEAGCRIHAPDCTVVTPEQPYESTYSLVPGQRSRWPNATRADGASTDLREIAGPEAGTHDHAYLTDLVEGSVRVENPRLGLEFELRWDASLFRWLVNWRPFGGSRTEPLAGIYGTALEPWVSSSNLADALAADQALVLAGGSELTTQLTAGVHRVDPTPLPEAPATTRVEMAYGASHPTREEIG